MVSLEIPNLNKKNSSSAEQKQEFPTFDFDRELAEELLKQIPGADREALINVLEELNKSGFRLFPRSDSPDKARMDELSDKMLAKDEEAIKEYLKITRLRQEGVKLVMKHVDEISANFVPGNFESLYKSKE